MQPATTPEAAAYIQAHWDLLTAYSRSTRFRPHFVDPDDFRADLVEIVLTKHHTFRHSDDQGKQECPHCGRRGCSTWLGWRARGVGTHHLRRRDAEQAVLDVWAPAEEAAVLPAHDGSPARIHARAQVQQLLDRATPEHRAALVSKLEEWDGDDVWAALGISLGGRNYRLTRLRATLDTP
jgi:DNA-directed RNA polymerase specialized sigma24 family protein